MTEVTLPLQPGTESAGKVKTQSAFVRVIQYSSLRLIALFITVVIGVYLTIIIANMGGYVDEIRRGYIREQVALTTGLDPTLKDLTTEERHAHFEALVALQEKAMGLDQPFAVRSFRFLSGALTLNLGWADNMVSDSGSRQVRLIILERLPATLLLFATAQFVLFFLSLFSALALSRNYGSLLDRIVLALAPTSAAPAGSTGCS